MIIHYSPGRCIYNPEVLIRMTDADKMRIGIDTKLKCKPGQDTFGIQLDILIKNGEEEVLNAGLLFAFYDKGFGEIIKKGITLSQHREMLERVCFMAWLAATGAIAAQTANLPGPQTEDTPQSPSHDGFILPPVSPEAIAKDIAIQMRPD